MATPGIRVARRARPDRRLACWLVIALLPLALPALAQNFSGLQGQTLEPIGDLGSTVTDLLLGGKGSITKVVVSDDSERRLALQVSYKKFAGRILSAEALGEDGKKQAQVRSEPVKLEAAEGTVEVVLALADDAPEGLSLETPRLQLTVARPGRTLPELVRKYQLGKRWQTEVNPENLVLRVVAQPVGTAAELREKPPGGAAPELKLPQFQELKWGLRAPLTTVPAPGAAPTPTPATTPTPTTTGPPLILMQPAKLSTQRTITRGTLAPRLSRPALTTPTPAGSANPDHLTATFSPSMLATAIKLRPAGEFTPGVPAEVTDRNGKGPGLNALSWLVGVNSDLPLTPDRITSIGSEIYQDQNPESGLFYFAPRAFGLDWTPDEGHALRMLYGATTGLGQAGEVNMWARLTARIDTAAMAVAEDLLKAYCSGASIPFTALRPLPLSALPAVSLSDALASQYNIPANRIHIEAVSDILAQIEVRWTTDTVTKENLQLALTQDVGIGGTSTLSPAGGVLGNVAIQVRIDLARPDTFGKFLWQRGTPWRNDTPYPVRLKHICALLLTDVPGAGRRPVVYAWSLGDTTVPPQAQVEIDASRIPSWIDTDAQQVWLDYAIPAGEDRAPYDDAVIREITAGVTSLSTYNITVKTLTPVADTGAAEITLYLRSRYFEAGSNTLQQKPATPLTEDSKEYSLGPIYLGDRQPGEAVPGDPLFEYRLDVIMPDGQTHQGAKWVPSDNLRVVIGSYQIREALGFLPGEDDAAGNP